MNRINKYKMVLGIKDSVNAEELKKLYRERAKVLHPDKNLDASSHEEFILLGEAYEFYSQLLEQLQAKKKEAFINSKKYPERYFQEKWNVEKRMAARKRAAQKAKMKYAYFEKQGYPSRLNKLFFIADLIKFVAALSLLFFLPVFLFFQDQFIGLIIALFVQLITYRLWSKAITRFIHS